MRLLQHIFFRSLKVKKNFETAVVKPLEKGGYNPLPPGPPWRWFVVFFFLQTRVLRIYVVLLSHTHTQRDV